MTQYLAVDIGGTFTDTVAFDPGTGAVNIGKALTTPGDLVEGVLNSLADAGIPLQSAPLLIHGSTLVINALIQRDGAKTGLLTTEGMRDVYEIGRINRPDSFNLKFHRPVPLIERAHRLEVAERLGADGRVISTLDEDDVIARIGELKEAGIESVAVVLLHAYRNPAHEKRILELLATHAPDMHASASHEISREYREYERTSTTAANAFVRPIVKGYLDELGDALANSGFAGQVLIMQSNGGLMSVDTAARQCIQMLESGPAGGVNGAARLANEIGWSDLIAFDMGGTTAKATVIRGGEAQMNDEYFVGDYATGLPLRVPSIDVEEVGTGGGSIAWLDSANGFHVGPRSAGAAPGPAAYGLGGTEPTVTDANIVLGRLEAGNFSDVGVNLNRDLAVKAVSVLASSIGVTAEQAALGILEVAIANMAEAVRAVTVKRGLDPRDFELLAYGGAGALHAQAVARDLGCRRIHIPRASGVFSAYGMLSADLRRDVVQSCFIRLDAPTGKEQLDELSVLLEYEAASELQELAGERGEITLRRFADMRYVGQEHTLTVRIPDGASVAKLKKEFDAEHAVMYSHSAPDEPAEVVSLRVSASQPTGAIDRLAPAADSVAADAGRTRPVVFDDPFQPVETPVVTREGMSVDTAFAGPVVIEDIGTSILVWPGSTVNRTADDIITITLRERD